MFDRNSPAARSGALRAARARLQRWLLATGTMVAVAALCGPSFAANSAPSGAAPDAAASAVAQGIADPKRACIVGASYGGYAAMWGIAKDPDLYRCAIAIAGVASLRREVNDFGHDLMENKYTDDWKRMTPDFLAVSPINAIPAIKAPLLLIHGEKDVTVDVTQSKSMYKRMLAAGKVVQFIDLPLADHHFGREADRKQLLTAMGAFLAKYDPADPMPAQVASGRPGHAGGAAH